MYIKYNNKTIKVINCINFYSRLKGFMFKKNIDYSLLFNKCNSIHTFFMKENIDVILCDKNNNILYYYSNFPKKGVSKVIETPSNYFDIKVNDKLFFFEE